MIYRITQVLTMARKPEGAKPEGKILCVRKNYFFVGKVEKMKPQKRFKAKKLKSRRKRCNEFYASTLYIDIDECVKSSQDCIGEHLGAKSDQVLTSFSNN